LPDKSMRGTCSNATGRPLQPAR